LVEPLSWQPKEAASGRRSRGQRQIAVALEAGLVKFLSALSRASVSGGSKRSSSALDSSGALVRLEESNVLPLAPRKRSIR